MLHKGNRATKPINPNTWWTKKLIFEYKDHGEDRDTEKQFIIARDSLNGLSEEHCTGKDEYTSGKQQPDDENVKNEEGSGDSTEEEEDKEGEYQFAFTEENPNEPIEEQTEQLKREEQFEVENFYSEAGNGGCKAAGEDKDCENQFIITE